MSSRLVMLVLAVLIAVGGVVAALLFVPTSTEEAAPPESPPVTPAPVAQTPPPAPAPAQPDTPAPVAQAPAAVAQAPASAPEPASETAAPVAMMKISGTVTDDATGEALSGALVAVSSVGHAAEKESADEADGGSMDAAVAAAAAAAASIEWEPPAIKSDSKGAYVLEVPVDKKLIALSCSTPGYAKAERRVVVEDSQEQFVDFALKPGAAVAGRVVETSGRGVEGIEVAAVVFKGGGFAELMAGRQTAASAVTDANGAYRIESLAPGSYSLEADPEDKGYISTQEKSLVVGVEARKDAVAADIVVEPGATVTGTVRNAKGAGVAKALVNAIPAQFMKAAMDLAGGGRPGQLMRSGMSEDSGQYTIVGLRFDTEYRLSAGTEGYANAAAGPFTIAKGSGSYRLDLTLTDGSMVSGKVKEANGRPAEGQNLTLMPEFSEMMAGQVQEPKSATSDKDGSFSFEHVSAGTYTVMFADPQQMAMAMLAPKEEKTTVEVDGVHPVKGLELTVPQAADGSNKTVTGVVVDASGQPVADAMVALKAKGMMPESANKTTGSDGKFAFDKLRSAVFEVTAKSETARADMPDVKLGSDIRLVLQPGATINGTVTDGDGAPVASCGVSMKVVSDNQFAAMFGDMMGGASKASATTNDQGVFTIDNVAAGDYTLEANVEAKGKGVEDVSVPAGGAVRVDIRLNPGARLSGRVRASGGSALAGATVKLIPRNDSSPMGDMSVMMSGMLPGQTGATNEDGRFEIPGIQDGSYSVVASCSGYANSPAQQLTMEGRDVENFDFALTKGGRARGQYLIDGVPAANYMLQLMGPGGMYMVTTDAEGRYDIEGITPGRYIASAINTAQMASGGMTGATPQQTVVEVAEGQDEALDIGPRGNITVSGQITGENLGNIVSISIRRPGGPNPEDIQPMDMNAGIEALAYQAGTAVMKPDGTFSIEGLEPGTYIVDVYSLNIDMNNPDVTSLASMDRTPQVRQELVITDGKPVELNISVPSAAKPE